MDDTFEDCNLFYNGFREEWEALVRKRALRARLNLKVVPKTGWGYRCSGRMRVGSRDGVLVTIVRR